MVQHMTVERSGARVGSKALIREMNEAIVLDVVRRRGVTSRADITAVTGLSAATVTGITAQLVGDGLLFETDVLRGTGGRPARLVELGRDAVVAVGVRLSRDAVQASLVNLRGEVIAQRELTLASTDPEVAAQAVVDVVTQLQAERPSARLRGVGIALSGIVDRDRGVVRHSGSLGWHDVAFAELVAARAGVRVAIDSLVNAFATGLLLLDDDLAERDAILVSVGVSIGASILVNGRIHRGFAGAAGGFAHSAPGVRDSSRPCHCGDAGCLETWSSLWGLRAERARGGGAEASLQDPAAEDILVDGGEHLGIAIANAAKMFGPERVVLVLSPELAVRDDAYESAVRRGLQREFAHGETRSPALAVIPADPEVFARGAGYGMIAELFSADRADSH